MKEYDIFVPLSYNDGSPVGPEKFQELQEVLLEHFGGLTFFPQPNRGFWRMAGVRRRDPTRRVSSGPLERHIRAHRRVAPTC